MNRFQTGIIGCVLALLTGCSETANSPEVLVERARVLERQGKFAEALEAYSGAIKQRPLDAMLHYDRGVVHGHLEQFDQAITEYTEAIKLDPALARAYNNRAVAHAQLKDFESAIKDCDRAIDLEPNDALAFRNRGLAFHDLGQFEKALPDYDTSIRNDGRSAISYFHRGNVYLESKKFDRAIEDYDQALKIDPKHALSLQNRGIAFASVGQRDKAEKNFATARQFDPKLQPAWPTEVVAAAPVVDAPKTVIQQVSAVVSPPLSTVERERARSARAIEVAVKHLESTGFRIERLGESEPWPLKCAKDDDEFVVLVKLADEDDTASVELSKTEIDAARESQLPVRLAIVSGVTAAAQLPADSAPVATGGEVAKFLDGDDWLRDERLTPTQFRLSLNGEGTK